MSEKNFIQDAIKTEGAFRKKAEDMGMTTEEYTRTVTSNPKAFDERTVRQANLAKTLSKLRKRAREKDVTEGPELG
tara:strand:+ start:8486 stop:8713 length:228 start_codon:yes stop_codon:yes gene_type:complete